MIISKTSLASVLMVLSGSACASNGILMSGYGVKNASMGGASIALPLDALAAANNPAGMGKVGTRIDGGVEGISRYGGQFL